LTPSNKIHSVIIATGLIALIDDCIKRHFHTETKHHQVGLPLTPLKMDFVGPKAMAEHMFKRRNSAASAKEKEHKGSPLRHESPIAAFSAASYRQS
jgi:hypothetical protein